MTERQVSNMSDDDMTKLIAGMEKIMGRLPTEDEVKEFIFGDLETKQDILYQDRISEELS